jgi:hypothetical protein
MKNTLLYKCTTLFATPSNKKNTPRFNGLLVLFIMVMVGGNVMGQTSPQTFSTTGTWTCPAGVNFVQVECWGAGGAGGSGQGNTTKCDMGGGAGGAYSKANSISVTPGTTYTVTVGTGGIGQTLTANYTTSVAGGDSWFISTSTVLAKGGAGAAGLVGSGTTELTTIGGVGTTTGSIGDVKFAGGNGANGGSGYGGGGGGSGAGTGSAGNSGSSNTAGAAVTGGGAGGNGRSNSSAGNGTTPTGIGGGGGGAYAAASSSQRTGGSGANGKVVLTWTVTPSVAISNGTIATGSPNNGQTNVILQRYDMAVTTANATLTGLTVTTAGTYAAADLTNLKVRYSTDATLDGADATLSTKTSSLAPGSQVFPSFSSQVITSGSTGYIFVTADIASGATNGNTINIASTAFSNITFSSGTKTGTDPVAAPGVQTITVAVPNIAISSNHPVAANINQNNNNQVFGSIALAVTTANATLNSIAITTAGTYQTSDLLASSFKLYYTSTNTFSSTYLLGSAQEIVASGGTLTFSGLSQTINSGDTGYLWLTVDVAYNAVNGRTLSATSTAFNNITFVSGTKTGTNPVTAGNEQTITTVIPSIVIAQNGPTASNVNLSTTNAILYGLSFAVTGNTTDFNSLIVTTGGTYQTSDLVASSFKLYYTTANSFSTTTQLSSQAIVPSGNTVTFSGINQNIVSGTTGYLWLTVDISPTAISNRTINITSTAFSNIMFAAGNKTGTDPVITGGVRTITAPPSMTELVVPQYIGSKSAASTNNTRTPIAICLQFDNLNASTAYDIGLQLELNGALASTFGAGNLWNGSAFSGTTLANAFTTNSIGSSGPVWFFITATGNGTRFDAGQIHNVRVKYVTNLGTLPTDPNFIGTKNITALDIANTARTVSIADDGAFITGTLPTQTSGKYVLLYTDETGTGDPIYAYQVVTSTATNTTQSELPTAINNIYLQSGTSNGQFAGVVPIGANNANGIRRIEVRNSDNSIFAAYSNSDGKWGSSADFTTLTRRSIGTLDYSNVNNLTLNGSMTLSAATSVFGNVTIQNSATLTTGDFLTLKSNAAGTASIGVLTTGTITGNATVERYIPAKRAWRALTSPLKGSDKSIFSQWQNNGTVSSGVGIELWNPNGDANPSSSNSGLAIGPNSSILQYVAGAWSGVSNTNSTHLFTTSGNNAFMVFPTGGFGSGNIASSTTAVATTLKATGQLITGDVNYSGITNASHTLIGNPYASPIDLNSILDANATLQKYFWVWDPNGANQGTYNLFDATANTYAVTNLSYTNSTVIQSGQSFFVKAATGQTGSFTISENNKSTATATNVFRNNTLPELLRVGLYKQVNNEWSGRDGAMTVILSDADANQVSNKMANGTENIAFTKNGASFASNHHLPLVASDVLNVKVWNTTAGANYKLKINTEEFMATNLEATLEDLFTNARTPLTLDGSAVEYPFTVTTEALSTGDRFRIVFQSSTLGTTIPKANGFSIVPNPVTGDSFQVNLGSLATGTYSYSICNTLGQEVEKGTIQNAAQNTNYEIKMSNSATGIYIMKIKGNDNSVFTAKIIKK